MSIIREYLSALRAAFIEELKRLYDGEHQIIEVLLRAIEPPKPEQWRKLSHLHLEETRTRVVHLEKLFAALKLRPQRKKCENIGRLIAEMEERAAQGPHGAPSLAAFRNLALYERATYRFLVTWAGLFTEAGPANALAAAPGDATRAGESAWEMASAGFNGRYGSTTVVFGARPLVL